MSYQDPGFRPSGWEIAGDHEQRIGILEATPDVDQPSYLVGGVFNAGVVGGFAKNSYKPFAGNANTTAGINDTFETTWLFQTTGRIEYDIANLGVNDLTVEVTHWYVVLIDTGQIEILSGTTETAPAGGSVNLGVVAHQSGSALLDITNPYQPEVLADGVYNFSLLLAVSVA